jgi:DNA helicase HerA-like ATPase
VYLSVQDISVKTNTDEVIIGKIPNTGIPLVFNKKMALSHHLAILGVTGTGKSVFARYLLRELLKEEDVKIICVDFTEEYNPKLELLQTSQFNR